MLNQALCVLSLNTSLITLAKTQTIPAAIVAIPKAAYGARYPEKDSQFPAPRNRWGKSTSSIQYNGIIPIPQSMTPNSAKYLNFILHIILLVALCLETSGFMGEAD